MANVLVIDSETCGLPVKGIPSDDPKQPHLCQFSALLIDIDSRQEVETIDVLIRPNGWQIPADMTAIHGISHIRALARGIPEEDVARKFMEMQDRAAITVAHHIIFDLQIMRIAMLRYGIPRAEADERTQRPNSCTMQLSTNIVNLPPTDRMLAVGLRVPKPPKLSECMKFFFDEDHEGAHNALSDARACAKCYFHIVDNYKLS